MADDTGEDIHQQLLVWITAEFKLQNGRGPKMLELFYMPAIGGRSEQLKAWYREETPEIFEDIPKIDTLVALIIQLAEEHAETMPVAPKHRYKLRVTQILGGRQVKPFVIEPSSEGIDEYAMQVMNGGGHQQAGAIDRAFDTQVRVNAQMYGATLGWTGKRMDELHHENTRLHIRVRELERDLDDARSTREERHWNIRKEMSKHERTDKGFEKLMSWGSIIVSKMLGPGSVSQDGEPDPLVMQLADFFHSMQQDQIGKLMTIFNSAQRAQFMEIVNVVRARAEAAEREAMNKNQANGHAHPEQPQDAATPSAGA
jgi:hypothetical protein